MNYQIFLQTLLQLSNTSQATLTVKDSPIYITRSKKRGNSCRLSMDVFKGDGSIPLRVRSFLPSTGILRWKYSSPHLRLYADTISLIDEIEIEKNKYIPFKSKIDRFIQMAQEWEEIFSDVKN